MAVTEQSARASRALDDLYRRHAAEVYRYTYAVLGNHADAEDVTQATFMNALRALERGERPRKPANWLLVIAHNLVRQRFRQAQARPVEVRLNVDVAHSEHEDEATPSVEELVQALGRIPPAQREAIVMREFEGRSYAEICEILQITTSALETLLFRARRSLADELENVVTCARAEQDVSRLLDGRLSRRERRRLMDHVQSCPSCARFEAFQRKQRRALKGLALLPLPASLTLFKGVHGASAAGLPTIGAAATAAATGGGAASGGAAFGGFALGGTVVKAAAVVAAAAVAAGGSYEGVQHVHVGGRAPAGPPAGVPATPTRAHGSPATKGPKPGQTRGHSRAGQAASSPGRKLVLTKGHGRSSATSTNAKGGLKTTHGRSGTTPSRAAAVVRSHGGPGATAATLDHVKKKTLHRRRPRKTPSASRHHAKSASASAGTSQRRTATDQTTGGTQDPTQATVTQDSSTAATASGDGSTTTGTANGHATADGSTSSNGGGTSGSSSAKSQK